MQELSLFLFNLNYLYSTQIKVYMSNNEVNPKGDYYALKEGVILDVLKYLTNKPYAEVNKLYLSITQGLVKVELPEQEKNLSEEQAKPE